MRLPVEVALDRRQPMARLLCRKDVEALTLDANGRCEIHRPNGQCDDATIDPVLTAVFPWLIVLHYRVGGHRESLVLPVSAIGAEEHRRLRVCLRWGKIDSAKQHESA